MMNTDFAMYVGIVYSYLPFMILPLYSNLEKHDLTLLEAAVDLGSKPFKAFLQITLPLSMPGIIAGSMLVFIPAVGEFVIPRLLGGTDSLMIGRVLWDEFFSNRDWPVASAVAICLLDRAGDAHHGVPALPDDRSGRGGEAMNSTNRSFFLMTALVLGLRLPLHPDPLGHRCTRSTSRKLVTVWGGFSTHWYGVLFNDRQMLEGVWLSLRIASSDGHGRRDCRHAGRLSSSRASAGSAAARCCRAWSPRRSSCLT